MTLSFDTFRDKLRVKRYDMLLCCDKAAQTVIVRRDKSEKAAHKRRTLLKA